MLFSPVFACTEPRSVSAEPPLLAPALSGSANQYLRRPSRPHHFPFLLFDFPVPPKLFRPLPPRAPKPRRIIDLQKSIKTKDFNLFYDDRLTKKQGGWGVLWLTRHPTKGVCPESAAAEEPRDLSQLPPGALSAER